MTRIKPQKTVRFSVCLYPDEIAFLDEFARHKGLIHDGKPNRSAALQAALQKLIGGLS